MSRAMKPVRSAPWNSRSIQIAAFWFTKTRGITPAAILRPPNVPLDYKALQSFDEPVWRKDRITAINQHFITAFLDLYLKGDQTRRAFLHVPVAHSNDGKWPLRRAPTTAALSAQVKTSGRAFSAAGLWD